MNFYAYNPLYAFYQAPPSFYFTDYYPIFLNNHTHSEILYENSERMVQKDQLIATTPKTETVEVPKAQLIEISQNFKLTEQDIYKYRLPKIKKIWTEQEDFDLLRLAQSFNNNWQLIAQHFHNRTPEQCYGRFKRVKEPFSKRKWTKDQDDLVKKYVELYGMNWKLFPQHFENRSPKQIRQRYLNYLKSNLIEKDWQIWQDLLLSRLVIERGKKWKSFECEFPNRSENMIKNRYYGHLERIIQLKKKQIRKRDNQDCK